MTRLDIISDCWTLVAQHFKDDEGKALAWFCIDNPHFGCSPAHMISVGREEKLLKAIEGMLDGNHP